VATLSTRVAGAQGVPPPEAEALVATPAAGAEAPKAEEKFDGTTASVAAGGMLVTGNSRQLALTGSGVLETLFDNNGIGFSLLGNYGRGAGEGEPVEVTAENIQGRLRYDRYLVDRLSVFLINTGRRDRFQGLDFRYNLDPGAKYLFVREPATSFWSELGYDFQYDVRRNDARVVLDADGNPVIDPATGQPELLDKTATDHSVRAFVGFRHAFNPEVSLTTGLEYLQSFVEIERARLNYDFLFAAKIVGGLSFGVGFSARFDNDPLPGKEKLDTTTTASLIYAFSNVVEPHKPPPCPPCPVPGPCPPPAPVPVAPAAVTPAPVAPPSAPAELPPAEAAPPPTPLQSP